MIQPLPSGPLAHAIGWALLHLVWQGTAVAALLALLLPRMSTRSANLRYLVSCAALALIVALGIVTAIESYPGATTTSTAPSGESAASPLVTEPRSSAPALAAFLRTPPDRLQAFARTASDRLPAIVAIWLVGVALLSLRLVLEWLRTRRLVLRSTSPARDRLQILARRLALALGVRHAVRLLESTAVEVPAVIGLVRPAILLPASTLTGLSPAQLEMILAHELAHIRRHDFLVNLLQTVVETLLFYHPAVWWISRQVRIERENCCDDLAVALCGSPLHYARALARLEELRPVRLPLAVSATGGSLFQRVSRLVSRSTPSTGAAVRGTSALALLSGLLLVFAAQSFSASRVREPARAATLAAGDATDAATLDVVGRPWRALAQASERLPSATPMAPTEASSSDDPAAALDPEATSTAEPGVTAEPDVAADPDIAAEPDDGRPTLEELIALRNQNVTPEMVREIRALFPGVELMEIVSLCAVGATPEFVRGMRHLGLDVPTAGHAQGLAAVGVTREYVRAMRAVGFPLTSADQAQSLKAVGVTPGYVREMRAAGIALDEADEAQSLVALGITPDFVRRLAKAGYRNPSVDQLSRLAAAGLTGDFVREMSRYRSR